MNYKHQTAFSSQGLHFFFLGCASTVNEGKEANPTKSSRLTRLKEKPARKICGKEHLDGGIGGDVGNKEKTFIFI